MDSIMVQGGLITLEGPLPPGIGFSAPGLASFQLLDSSGTALETDTLAGINWDLADWDLVSDVYVKVPLTGTDPMQPAYFELFGTIAHIGFVPEPTSGILLLAGLLGTGLAGCRRKPLE